MRYSLIVAGGSGTRMGSTEPKQFLLLKGRPLLMHTIEKFSDVSNEIAVVLPSSWIDHWKNLTKKHHFLTKHIIVEGGERRSDSVKAGLETFTGIDGIVAVHDAVRPLLSRNLIRKLFETAEEKGNAIPVIPVGDSVRMISENENHAVDRSRFVLVQTPQCFSLMQLKDAFMQTGSDGFTDEASMMENAGVSINLVQGEAANIKITLPSDLLFAENFIL